MYFEIDECARSCCIWIDQEHRDNYKNDAAYKNAVKKHRAEGYSICVFVGGCNPLVPVAFDLLHASDVLAA